MARKRKVSGALVQDPLAARWLEVALIVIGAFSILLLMALISYHSDDPGILHAGVGHKVNNIAGRFGAGLADLVLTFFGFFSYLLPPLLLVMAWNLGRQGSNEAISESKHSFTGMQIIGTLTTILSSTVLAHFLLQPVTAGMSFMPGGIFGSILAMGLMQCFNVVGSLCIAIMLWICGITLLTGFSWMKLVDLLGQYCISAGSYVKGWLSHSASLNLSLVKHVNCKRADKGVSKLRRGQADPSMDLQLIDNAEHVSLTDNKRKEPAVGGAGKQRARKPYALPKVQLLDGTSLNKVKKLSTQQIEQMSRDVEHHLKDFNIAVNVVAVLPGPVITRFELQLAAGTKVSKITALAKDLARSLSVVSVRIVEVIPGKPVIGLEIPNESREIVRLRQIICSKAYSAEKTPLPLALGKDISGNAITVDLAQMPHCLVAGTTGSGKSVGINAMILSLLYRSTPDELRLILIDPKMLELSVYDGIPHLLTPVVTDMKDAGRALRWCVHEMDKRYRLLAAVGVRNVASFNALIKTSRQAGNPMLDPLWQSSDDSDQVSAPELTTLPNIVVCADEFADMIMVVGKKVEELITRLAQKARAAGIHLILATQRPSVDVITGLIKANISTRIAYQVSSKVDSRTVLDQHGAEQLLGDGDMLYLSPGTGLPIRVHGAYVGDEELRQVTAALKAQGDPQYLAEITDGSVVDLQSGTDGNSSGANGGDEKDALYDQAVKIVIETKRASISNIQRRLKIGYNRAARIVDTMEDSGLVTPMDNNGSRTINVSEFEGEAS